MLLPRSNNVCHWLSNVTRRRDKQEKLYVTQRRLQSSSLKMNKKMYAVMCNVVIVSFIKLALKKVSFRNQYRSHGIGIGTGTGTGIKHF